MNPFLSLYMRLLEQRYATSVPSPTSTKTYGPAYSDVIQKLPQIPPTTTWGSWLPNHTEILANDTNGPYGQAAWSSLWQQVKLEDYTTTGLYSTTSWHSGPQNPHPHRTEPYEVRIRSLEIF
ncbi:hypothetical protein P170DRAFT_424371 [Aspergillus steynii IBT 23096]|uniref:Uncharacterized protein n=1 Tax=Aspergillus steynii IBT 23096 TaxID=1392250 RepID=A0A2I2GAM9_9EURO|nr:uncharacterized protein P170DRAFT_424371 [Aspergillus steynii IBT 23096]PLB49934.1 hypothetical protein P170DRAFT_424371 [Aspergillus steynii IBT 23096]